MQESARGIAAWRLICRWVPPRQFILTAPPYPLWPPSRGALRSIARPHSHVHVTEQLRIVRACESAKLNERCLSQHAEKCRRDARCHTARQRDTAKQTCHAYRSHRSMSGHNEHLCASKRVADVIEWLNAIEPSVTKHFSNNALQSNDNKIQWARDGCVLKATNFHGFLRANKWCRDAPAVKSNRCGPDLFMGVQFQ